MHSAPSGTPQGFNTSSFNFTNATVQWTPVECSLRNGPIDGYRLIYNHTSYNQDGDILYNDTEVIFVKGNPRSFTIIGLQPSITYTMTVEAINRNYSSFGPKVYRAVVTSQPNGKFVIDK